MGGNSLIIIIVIIAIAGIFLLPRMLKKKRAEKAKALISQRHDKDEVWKTIKQYLKDTNQYGVEIVDTYVIRRNPVEYINPLDSSYVKDKVRAANALREFQFKQELLKAKKIGKNARFMRPKQRDLYVVLFQTKNIKTNELLPPQAIECEVVTKKINRKEWDRKILINGKLNYDNEMIWIAPARALELQHNAKNIAATEVKQKKIIAKAQKKKEKELAKKKAKEAKQKAIEKN